MRRPSTLRMRMMLGTAVLLTLAGLGFAQFQPPAPAPAAPLPPLMYLRVAGPKGMKVTLYRGEPAGVTLDAPIVIGVRPGYSYRFAVSNVPGFPGATFSPTLEVRGSLLLSAQLRNADFPATLLLREEDFVKAEQGALLRRVIVLEHPETAAAKPAAADEPIEFAVASVRNLADEVMARGAPLAVVYLGQRTLSPAELIASAIPGTLLLPGEKSLPQPRLAPWVPWSCYALHDPLHGPESAKGYLTLYDGGDSGLRAGYDRFGKLRGLDPSDTVAEYTDAQGRPRIVPSNRVALCVPRYVVLKTETGLASQTVAFGTGTALVNQGRAVFDGRMPFAAHTQPLHLDSAASRVKASGTQFTAGTAVTGRINGLQITANMRGPSEVDGSCPPPVTPTLERPLKIIKWPDKKGCNVGDIVTFSLQFTNHGSQPITNVVVSDNLTTRFEYVPSSQKTDREAAFTTQPNEAGSALLRWEFPGAIPPGASGLITFQVRVR